MKKIILISCVAKKQDSKFRAADLYQSALFKKSMQYALRLDADEIYILSAKYHLVSLDKIIEPYNLTLKEMKPRERILWGKVVAENLKKVADLDNDKFILLAGRSYIEPLEQYLKNIECPLRQMRIGERLKFLTQAIQEN